MKKSLVSGIFVMLAVTLFAQVPQSFQYQAVVRDASGTVLESHAVNFQIEIISGPLPGTVEYVETHTTTTNAFGIVTLSIGNGNTTDNFANINWGNAPHFIKVEVDATGSGYIDMGTTQLLSVPYALYSETSGNAGQTYTAGSGITISNDTIINTSINTDAQILSINGDTLSISGGNSVTLTDNVADADADPTNELQVISISNDTIYLSNGGFVKIPAGFNGDYNSLTNAPTNVSAFTNDAGYLSSEVDGSVTNELAFMRRDK